jgi:hypothetical protein
VPTLLQAVCICKALVYNSLGSLSVDRYKHCAK